MRYEIKYAIASTDVLALKVPIQCHPASFREAFPDRWVNNIYFDTPEFHCFRQNIDGSPLRSKLRLRWYGHEDLPSKAIVEVKHKDHELGWKDLYPIQLEGIESADQLSEQVADLGLFSSTLIPTLNNRYLRSYYLSLDKKFRITVDRNQSFKKPFTNQMPLSTDQHASIIELKFDKDAEDEASFITSNLPFRQTKNSKYSIGITHLYF